MLKTYGGKRSMRENFLMMGILKGRKAKTGALPRVGESGSKPRQHTFAAQQNPVI
jgi:hypothetical protein